MAGEGVKKRGDEVPPKDITPRLSRVGGWVFLSSPKFNQKAIQGVYCGISFQFVESRVTRPKNYEIFPHSGIVRPFGLLVLNLRQFTFPAVKFFTGLLGGSAIFNIIWMAQNEQNGFIKLLRFIPTFIAFALAVRQRGGQFAGLGIRGGDLSGVTACPKALVGERRLSKFGLGTSGPVLEVSCRRAIAHAVPHPAPQAPAAAPGAYQTA
ncbi:hypothetical protein K438DRAFT_1762854 [Mycena galopus ATCC 62051]|nr:hypothetical protein K438DRAFT_1762854 [Mycena galopus ATCC 62051]